MNLKHTHSPADFFCDDAFHLGEGPTYDPDVDKIYWFDILEQKLLESAPDGSGYRSHSLPWMASVLARVDAQQHLLAAEDGLYLRDISSGKISTSSLKPLEADNPNTRSNDGRVHPAGALWISTMGKSAEVGQGKIYWYRAGELKQLFQDLTIPNGICFSPDGGTAYFTCTIQKCWYQVKTDPQTGLPLGEPSMFYDHSMGEGGIDGAVVDADGVLWNARWGAGCIDSYSPDGERLQSIQLPVTQPSCPAFMGEDFSQLLVTSAYESMDAGTRAQHPHEGRPVYLRVGSRGLPEPRVVL